MHKDDVRNTEYVKHSRNSAVGKRGVNKARRRTEKAAIRKELTLRGKKR